MTSNAVLVDGAGIPMRDGVVLYADVYRPVSGGPWPVLLIRTPYGIDETASSLEVLRLARSGWAIVIQNVRGRGGSGGVFLPFENEVVDGADTVGWCAIQPFSTGQVAMTGASYAGYTQWAAASSSDVLGAIAPQVTATDAREWFWTGGGALRHGFASSWGLSLAYTSPLDEGNRSEIDHCAAYLDELYRYSATASPVRRLFPVACSWFDDDRDYWDRIRLKPSIRIPAYHVTGWFDVFAEPSISDYVAACSLTDAPQRLLIGPWTHSELFGQIAGEVDHGPDANGGVIEALFGMYDWLRRALAGEDVVAGVRAFVIGAGWRNFDRWPPLARTTRFYLGTDVLTIRPSAALSVQLKFDPADPVPSLGGRLLHAGPVRGGQASLDRLAGRQDVLVFRSAPLEQALTIAGGVRATIRLQSDAPIDVVATLASEDRDGRMNTLVTGHTRLPLGAGRTVTINVGQIAVRVAAGRRIALVLAGSDFPNIDTNPAATSGPTVHTVVTGRSSFLDLPVIDDEGGGVTGGSCRTAVAGDRIVDTI